MTLAVPNPQKIRSVYEELAPRLIRVTQLPVEVAEDLVQEAFLRLLTKPPKETDNLAAWLTRVFKNLVMDHYRSQGRWQNLEVPTTVAEVTETESVIASWLAIFLAYLPAGYGRAVAMADLEGLSMRTIAEQLDLSVSGAKSRVQRGRVMLRKALWDCCLFEFDEQGRAVAYQPNPGACNCQISPKDSFPHDSQLLR